jgi:hypothetical protein
MPVAHQSPAAIIGQLVGMGAETRSPIATNLIAVYKALAGGWAVGEGKPIVSEAFQAMAYKYSLRQPFVYPKNELDYTSNFLRMCFAVPTEEYKINPVFSRALDRIFILHADHEQNPSTATVRIAGSSGANPFACINRMKAGARSPPFS